MPEPVPGVDEILRELRTLAGKGWLVPLSNAEAAVLEAARAAADTRTAEIVDAIREIYDGFDHDKIDVRYGLAYKEVADSVARRFPNEGTPE